VRCFEDDDIVHVNGKDDPRSDIDVINLELIFSDLEQIEKKMTSIKGRRCSYLQFCHYSFNRHRLIVLTPIRVVPVALDSCSRALHGSTNVGLVSQL
jgi:hypothetical protein